jgi:SsrA-binding protein
MSPAKPSKENDGDGRRVIARNRRARFSFELIERLEAGIVLRGTEVKSLREGQASLNEAYARIRAGEVWLIGCHIPEYRAGSWANHEPTRPRKLLLSKHEIKKLDAKVTQRGQTLVPVSLYFNARGIVKVELALARGKKTHDKRDTIKERDTQRDLDRRVKRG